MQEPKEPMIHTVLVLDESEAAWLFKQFEAGVPQVDLFHRLVDERLDGLVTKLRDAGLRGRRNLKKQRRKVYAKDWARIGSAAEELGVDQITLLRCLLQQEMKG